MILDRQHKKTVVSAIRPGRIRFLILWGPAEFVNQVMFHRCGCAWDAVHVSHRRGLFLRGHPGLQAGAKNS